MTAQSPDAAKASWQGVDEGWGREAVEFATLSEPSNCREYVWLHHRLGVGRADRLLDVACGAGLAIELARLRGAACAGIDASSRLVAVARDRNPEADVRVGDMNALPWDDGSFDLVTSFRGIWGTTPGAVAEARRVLRPGGRFGFTVWGHLKASPGSWALAPFRLAAEPKVANQAAMVALGRPGVGEALLADTGFVDVERYEVPFVWEFADPEAYARALASTGPAYEAIEAVGADEFHRHAVEVAQAVVRTGLPLRAEIAVVAFLARTPAAVSSESTFLPLPELNERVQGMYDDDMAEHGFVMNVSRLWGHLPDVRQALFDLLGQTGRIADLSMRQRGILITACASTLGDSYCSLAWGERLANEAGPGVAAGVLRGDDTELDAAEQALARWARAVAGDPNSTGAADVHSLREAGYDDAQILAITVFVALRLAFSSVNDALGASPDAGFATAVPAQVRQAVDYGRAIERPLST
jgi:SAM-dependent methyltransferase